MKFNYKSAILSLVFVSNLSVGSTGPDVTALQKFLVSNGFLVIPSGVSYGYYGSLTKTAVAKWQVANGISPALGYFGPISRATLASLTVASSTVSAPSAPSPNLSLEVPFETDTPYALGMRANRVMLFRAFPYEVKPGDSITLDGSGFSKTLNKVYFNGSSPATATSTDGTVLKVSLPTSLSEGEYNLSVTNVLGSSDPSIKVSIKVTDNPNSGPVILSASINGDKVTVTGSGFTSSNNLFTTFGNSSSSISSDGNIIIFSVNELSLYKQIKDAMGSQHYSSSLWIYVQNEHGVNKDPYKLDIVI